MQNKFKVLDFFLVLVLSILLSFIIILFSSMLVIGDSEFYRDTGLKNNVYEQFWNKFDVDIYYTNMADYLTGRAKLLDLYDQRETEHLSDVKNLISNLKNSFYFMSAILFVILSFMRYSKYKYLWMIFAGCFFIIIALSLVLYLYSLFNFFIIFDLFHNALFSADSWIFDEHSLLIKLFPEAFFIDALKMILIYSFFIGLLSLSASYYFKAYLNK